jgi:hypothetical protein
VESADNPVDRHAQNTTTPSKSLSKDMHDEDGPGIKDIGVTFNDTSSDHGVSAIKTEIAITSITSDPPLSSRRAKRRSKSNGRTSESFTRSDQAYTRWENFIYDSLFTDMPYMTPCSRKFHEARYTAMGEGMGPRLVFGSMVFDLSRPGRKEVFLLDRLLLVVLCVATDSRDV